MKRKVVIVKSLESLGWWKPDVYTLMNRNFEVLIELSRLDGHPPL